MSETKTNSKCLDCETAEKTIRNQQNRIQEYMYLAHVLNKRILDAKNIVEQLRKPYD